KTPYPGTADGVLNPEYDTVFEHMTALTFASAITSRIRLGVSVINIPFYNPVMLGRRVATMDQLSDGRVTLGVGLAWSEDECDVNNVPFRERGRIGEEAIEAPVDDPNRPVAVGTWDQIRDDALKLAEAGVDETFFDVAFQPDVDDLKSYLSYLERFRAILEAPVAV